MAYRTLNRKRLSDTKTPHPRLGYRTIYWRYLSDPLARQPSNLIGPYNILCYQTNILVFYLTPIRLDCTIYMVIEQYGTCYWSITMNDLESVMTMISGLVHGNYNDILALIGLACAGAFVLYFCNDLRQAGRRARCSRRSR